MSLAGISNVRGTCKVLLNKSLDQGIPWISALSALLALLLGLPQASAKSFVVSDFDETLVRCRDGGAFKTNVRLFLVESRNSMLLDPLPAERIIEVSCTDYEHLREHLAFSPSSAGVLSHTFTLEDGRTIIPGHYYFDGAQSFYPYYYQHLKGGNYLTESHQAALSILSEATAKVDSPIKKLQISRKMYFGALWPIVEQWLMRADTANRVHGTTARAQTEREWSEYWDSLLSSGLTEAKFPPNLKRWQNVSLPEFDRFERDARQISVRKVKPLLEFALDLRKLTLKDSDLRLNADGNATELGHTLVFLDDNQATLKLFIAEFSKLATSRVTPVKAIILNAGTDAEVQDMAAAGVPRYAVINSTGLIREATPHEVFGENPHISAEKAKELMTLIPPQVSVPSCEERLKSIALDRAKLRSGKGH